MPTTVIHRARRVVTLDPDVPEATAVAVHDGRILSVGSLDEVTARVGVWGHDHRVDDTFADLVLTPGLIEAHSHLQMEGGLWAHTYVGGDDRTAPDGELHPGCTDLDDAVDRLRHAFGGDPLVGWCFDPAQTGEQPLTREHLDRVSGDVPVLVLNRSLHLGYANTPLLEKMGAIDGPAQPGVLTDGSGAPTGELHEMAALGGAMAHLDGFIASIGGADAVRRGARLAHRVGATTSSDLLTGLGSYGDYREATDPDDFPVRVAASPGASVALNVLSIGEVLDRIAALDPDSFSERLILGPVKLMVDGSIQGRTAAISWPGYCGGDDHTTLNFGPDEITAQIRAFHQAGHQIAVHTNGDAATTMTLDAFETVLSELPRPDHRHRLEHCQLATRADFERMRALGVGVNLFANHLWHWGDLHHDRTVGPDRAARMNACATAEELGLAWSIHSDSPVTPIDPRFTMWCAANRRTRSGRLLGEAQRVSPLVALKAMTLGSARLIKRDRELGSVTPGKRADLTVWADDPTTAPAEQLKDLELWGTVLSGRLQPIG